MLTKQQLEEKIRDCCKKAVSLIQFNKKIPNIDPKEFGVYYEPVVLGRIFEEALKNNIIGMNTRDWCDWSEINWDPTFDSRYGDAIFYEDIVSEMPHIRIDVKIGVDFFGAINKHSIENFSNNPDGHFYCLVRMRDNGCLFINANKLKKYYDEFENEKIDFISEKWLKEHTPFVTQ